MKAKEQGEVAIGCAIATVLLTVIGLGVIAVVPFIVSIVFAINAKKHKSGVKQAEIAEKILIGYIILLVIGILWVFGGLA